MKADGQFAQLHCFYFLNAKFKKTRLIYTMNKNERCALTLNCGFVQFNTSTLRS